MLDTSRLRVGIDDVGDVNSLLERFQDPDEVEYFFNPPIAHSEVGSDEVDHSFNLPIAHSEVDSDRHEDNVARIQGGVRKIIQRLIKLRINAKDAQAVGTSEGIEDSNEITFSPREVQRLILETNSSFETYELVNMCVIDHIHGLVDKEKKGKGQGKKLLRDISIKRDREEDYYTIAHQTRGRLLRSKIFAEEVFHKDHFLVELLITEDDLREITYEKAQSFVETFNDEEMGGKKFLTKILDKNIHYFEEIDSKTLHSILRYTQEVSNSFGEEYAGCVPFLFIFFQGNLDRVRELVYKQRRYYGDFIKSCENESLTEEQKNNHFFHHLHYFLRFYGGVSDFLEEKSFYGGIIGNQSRTALCELFKSRELLEERLICDKGERNLFFMLGEQFASVEGSGAFPWVGTGVGLSLSLYDVHKIHKLIHPSIPRQVLGRALLHVNDYYRYTLSSIANINMEQLTIGHTDIITHAYRRYIRPENSEEDLPDIAEMLEALQAKKVGEESLIFPDDILEYSEMQAGCNVSAYDILLSLVDTHRIHSSDDAKERFLSVMHSIRFHNIRGTEEQKALLAQPFFKHPSYSDIIAHSPMLRPYGSLSLAAILDIDNSRLYSFPGRECSTIGKYIQSWLINDKGFSLSFFDTQVIIRDNPLLAESVKSFVSSYDPHLDIPMKIGENFLSLREYFTLFIQQEGFFSIDFIKEKNLLPSIAMEKRELHTKKGPISRDFTLAQAGAPYIFLIEAAKARLAIAREKGEEEYEVALRDLRASINSYYKLGAGYSVYFYPQGTDAYNAVLSKIHGPFCTTTMIGTSGDYYLFHSPFEKKKVSGGIDSRLTCLQPYKDAGNAYKSPRYLADEYVRAIDSSHLFSLITPVTRFGEVLFGDSETAKSMELFAEVFQEEVNKIRNKIHDQMIYLKQEIERLKARKQLLDQESKENNNRGIVEEQNELIRLLAILNSKFVDLKKQEIPEYTPLFADFCQSHGRIFESISGLDVVVLTGNKTAGAEGIAAVIVSDRYKKEIARKLDVSERNLFGEPSTLSPEKMLAWSYYMRLLDSRYTPFDPEENLRGVDSLLAKIISHNKMLQATFLSELENLNQRFHQEYEAGEFQYLNDENFTPRMFINTPLNPKDVSSGVITISFNGIKKGKRIIEKLAKLPEHERIFVTVGDVDNQIRICFDPRHSKNNIIALIQTLEKVYREYLRGICSNKNDNVLS